MSNYDSSLRVEYCYLIKYKGVWSKFRTYDKSPDWVEEVTDVISMPHILGYNEPRWRKKNCRRYTIRQPEIVKEEDLTLILLQAKDIFEF